MYMKLNRCKLSRNNQSDLLQFFVAEVTARTAADLSGLPRPTVTLFYHKLRTIIAWYLEQEAEKVFAGSIELDKRYCSFGLRSLGLCASLFRG